MPIGTQCDYCLCEAFFLEHRKNIKLKQERGVGFEDVLVQINNGDILDIVDNPNTQKYPNQKIFIIKINEYVYYVPFVEDANEVFLKSIIPSRTLNKLYSGGKKK